MWSDLTWNPPSSQTRTAKLEVLITCFLLVLQVCNVTPTYRKLWAGNLLMWSDFSLGPSFKVKRWFTGFGELSFRWIQIYLGSPMHESSLFMNLVVNYYFVC